MKWFIHNLIFNSVDCWWSTWMNDGASGFKEQYRYKHEAMYGGKDCTGPSRRKVNRKGKAKIINLGEAGRKVNRKGKAKNINLGEAGNLSVMYTMLSTINTIMHISL